MAERAEKKGGRILPRLAALVCLAVLLWQCRRHFAGQDSAGA